MAKVLSGAGLRGQVAGKTALSTVGKSGSGLTYRGYDVKDLANSYHVSPEAIVLAFILRHPFNIIPVVGTSNPDRIRACAQAINIRLTREDWYRLYESARGAELP